MKRPNLRLISSRAGSSGSTLLPFRDQALRDVLMGAFAAASPAASSRLVLRLESLPKDPEDALISVDAVYHGPLRTQGALTVRVRRPPLPPATAARVAAAALEQFGDLTFTSLSAWRSGERDASDTFDVTISFPHVLPFVSRNWLIVPPLLSADEARLYSRLLHVLGVAHRRYGTDFRFSSLQLRGRLQPTAPIAALRAALEGELDAALYAAALPVTQSMRIEQVALPSGNGHLDCVLSRGLSSSYTCGPEDADEMQGFLERHLDVKFVGRLWRATSSSIGTPLRAAQQPRSQPRPSQPTPTPAPPGRPTQRTGRTAPGAARGPSVPTRGAKVIPLSRARRPRGGGSIS